MIYSARQVSKSFPGVKSLDKVDFSVDGGEIRALVGENGAGKSTLIKIIAGAYAADEGVVDFEGRSAAWHSPHQAQRAGIHVIYQELVLFPEMTVAQNIYAGEQLRNRLGLLDRKAMRRGAADILAELGLPLDPAARVKELSVAQQQMVEIARALNSQAKLIIFDEPTAVLGGPEVKLLIEMMRRLKSRGVAVIFVSHRLDEVFEIADTVTVLKDGKLVATEPVASIDHGRLVSMMVGRRLADIYPPKPQKRAGGEEIITATDIWAGGRVKGVSLSVRAGEIVGLAGMVGAGRTEFAHAIFGSLPLEKGSVKIRGVELQRPTPSAMIAGGVGFLTEDRKGEGLFMLLDIAANVSAPSLDKISGRLRLDRKAEFDLAAAQIKKYAVAATGPRAAVVNLSGGNQQKVLFGRWENASHAALILDEPTRGVDVGAKMEIYRIIRQLSDQGMAILLISSEMSEIIGICERVVVMREGRKTGELEGSAITEEALLSLAVAGGGREEAA